MNIKLNDFLLLEFGGKGIVATKENVLLEEFFKEPARYIRDAGVLNEIQKTGAYLRMERTVREEMDMEEEVRRLQENGISTLRGWSLAAAGIRADVHDKNKDLLNTAFVELMNSATTSAARYLEG
ncbi:retrotransposon hot spot (RHS) protein, putative, partial [Trypanosoma cruzi]